MKFEGGSDLFTTNRHTIHNSSAGTYIYIYIYQGRIQESVRWRGGDSTFFIFQGGRGSSRSGG